MKAWRTEVLSVESFPTAVAPPSMLAPPTPPLASVTLKVRGLMVGRTGSA